MQKLMITKNEAEEFIIDLRGQYTPSPSPPTDHTTNRGKSRCSSRLWLRRSQCQPLMGKLRVIMFDPSPV